MPEDYICPVCLAFKDPATGVCLVCGKKYHSLDIPISLEDGVAAKIADFIIPFQNGFITFKAKPMMEINKRAALTFEFLPDLDTDNNDILYTIYRS